MEKAPRLNPRSSVIGFKKTPKVKTLIGPAPTRSPQIVANTTHQRLRNRLVIARSLDLAGFDPADVMLPHSCPRYVRSIATATCCSWAASSVRADGGRDEGFMRL